MKNLLSLLLSILMLVSLPEAEADMPSTHGMLLVGSRALFASHLPMFHRPHDYQVILEIALSDEDAAAYQRDRESSGVAIYTLLPETFVLPDVVAEKRSFHADLYRGHFERGGVVVRAGIEVAIRQVVYFKKFVPGQSKPDGLEYLLFGRGADVFVAHLITSAPDFDQVLAARAVAAVPSPRIYLKGRPQSEPLRPGEVVPGVRLGREIYFETGDLSGR